MKVTLAGINQRFLSEKTTFVKNGKTLFRKLLEMGIKRTPAKIAGALIFLFVTHRGLEPRTL